jgi:hypothetical protein
VHIRPALFSVVIWCFGGCGSDPSPSVPVQDRQADLGCNPVVEVGCAAISGSIEDEEGEPITWYSVEASALPQDRGVVARQTVTSYGGISLQVPAGRYRLRFFQTDQGQMFRCDLNQDVSSDSDIGTIKVHVGGPPDPKVQQIEVDSTRLTCRPGPG